MKKNSRFLKELRKHVLYALALALPLGGAGGSLLYSCSPDYDLGINDPDWLSSSIYDFLTEDGNFTNTVRLIDDLNYADVLNTTGSKTLFVADDAAFERFYKHNDWGVSCYEDLTNAQKKMLLFGTMINNSCQVAYLSSSEGTDRPIEGNCMRRLTSASIYDSVPLIAPAQMPDGPYWQYYKENNKTIPLLMDNTTTPMIHFIEDFLKNHEITNEDCDFLFNVKQTGAAPRVDGDANVNGIKMIKQNIKCSNGFVHQMAEVITPLPNMAQLISQREETSQYAKLLNRFCAPYYDEEATHEYNRLYNTNYDSVFQKRFFSLRSHGEAALELTPSEGPVNGLLKFDPGWNEFYSETSAGIDVNVALKQNMGVMLVPSNAALERYWNEGAGKALKDRYGSWDNVPDKVVSKMINVNMLNSFVNSVPSKFTTVLNDANDDMKVRTDSIDEVWMACNGAVYLTNCVFNPVAYISVSFPALVNESMSILYWAIEQCGYDVYLNSQNSYYSLFVPTNDACLEYIDPCSYGKRDSTLTQLFRFHYKPDALTEEERVWASIWSYNMADQTVGDSIGEASLDQIKNRLEDILNTHIVIGNVEDGNEYYKTKGGTYIRVKNASAGANGMTVQGSKQIDDEKELAVTRVYDQSYEGNGKTYIIESEPIQTTSKTVSQILSEHEEFSLFYDYLSKSEFLETKHVIGTDEHGCAGNNINVFNTFQYTVYVPTNAAISHLINEKKLPTWDDVAEANAEGDEELADSLTHEINQFLKYHIQDNAMFIGQGNVTSEFETSAYKIEDDNLMYYRVKTNVTDSGISITDESGKTCKVTKKPGLYNLMAREYQFDTADAARATNIYTTSCAVVHQIDDVLNYKKGGTK